jgi:hypothetical protein
LIVGRSAAELAWENLIKYPSYIVIQERHPTGIELLKAANLLQVRRPA